MRAELATFTSPDRASDEFQFAPHAQNAGSADKEPEQFTVVGVPIQLTPQTRASTVA